MADLDVWVGTRDMPLRSYGLWHFLRELVHDAVELHDWSSVGELLKLYDFVHLAGKRGEMWEASYVAFLEDVHLPREPADLRKFWQVCPPNFLGDIQYHRGIRQIR